MMAFSYILIIVGLVFIIHILNQNHIKNLSKNMSKVKSISNSIYTFKESCIINENEVNSLIHSPKKLAREDWNRIELFINYYQNNFVLKLRQEYISLSEDDIHIILLMRMGLNHEEIATSYNILLSSFRKRRSRLKKKMNVECDSISIFINTLFIN